MSRDHGDQPYHAQDAIGPAFRGAGVTGAAGLFVASIQATLTRQNIGAFSPFTHYGGTIAIFGMECWPTGKAVELTLQQPLWEDPTSSSAKLQQT